MGDNKINIRKITTIFFVLLSAISLMIFLSTYTDYGKNKYGRTDVVEINKFPLRSFHYSDYRNEYIVEYCVEFCNTNSEKIKLSTHRPSNIEIFNIPNNENETYEITIKSVKYKNLSWSPEPGISYSYLVRKHQSQS